MLEQAVAPDTAGNPQTNQKWFRGSTRKIADYLKKFKVKISGPSVARLLKKQGYSLRVNHKKHEASSVRPDRDTQFKQIEKLRLEFYREGSPVISCDTKKKELIGLFKNAGSSWVHHPIEVNAHDFPGEALGRAVPYGIYDLRYKQGSVYVGESADTPEFAVKCIGEWWRSRGQFRYNGAKRILILVDSGGSNSCRARIWKYLLQKELSERYGLVVVVSHYPTGCSKWNPIEHQLFSQISTNWAGQPLSSWEKLLGLIRGTTTKGGLQVEAQLIKGVFELGKTVSKEEMADLKMEWGDENPQWNYALLPTLKPQLELTTGLARTGS